MERVLARAERLELISWRVRLGLTLEELAEGIERDLGETVDVSTLSRYETGARRPLRFLVRAWRRALEALEKAE